MSNPTVHHGKDGWLFYVGLTGEVVQLYRRSFRSWRMLRRWRRTVEARADRFAASGIRHVSLVVPEKITIFPEHCPDLEADPALSPATRLAELMRRSPAADSFLDLVPVFAGAPNRDALYPRTDTHWSFEGCLLAYRALCARLDAEPRGDLRDRPWDELPTGDLGVKLVPPPREGIRLFRMLKDASRTHVNDLIQAFETGRITIFPGVGSYAEFRNEAAGADPRRVLVFGTSASNFVPMYLTGMLAETFREVHFVWSPLVDWDLVERLKPDIVVYEIIERALGWIAADRFDLEAVAERTLADAVILTEQAAGMRTAEAA